jgi:hypothetical protein
MRVRLRFTLRLRFTIAPHERVPHERGQPAGSELGAELDGDGPLLLDRVVALGAGIIV